MVAITATEARKRLFPLIQEVSDDHTAVEIVSKNGSAVLMSAEDYSAWQTTAHLFSSPANARRIMEAYEEAIAGNAQPRELIEVDDDE